MLLVAGAALVAVLVAGSAYGGDVWPPSTGGDVSNMAYAQPTSDVQLGNMVVSPTAKYPFAGSGSPTMNYNDLFRYGSNTREYEIAKVIDKARWRAGFTPAGIIASVVISTVGAYATEKLGSWWFHWLDGQWGNAGADPSSTVCGTATDTSSGCKGFYVPAGGTVCLGYNGSGTLVNYTMPAAAWIAESSVWPSPSPCGTGYQALAVRVDFTTQRADADSIFGAANEVDTHVQGAGGHDYLLWTTAPSSSQGNLPAGGGYDNIQPYTGQPYQYSGTPGNPTTAMSSQSIRIELTGPNDYCGTPGTTCPWGSGANPSQPNATGTQQVVNCALTSCPSSSISDTLTAPNCAGMSVAACEGAFVNLGYTGSFVETHLPIDGADLTQPAGAVVDTVPATGATVSTSSSTTVTLDENPDPLPLELLQPLPDETYTDYVARLQAAGWVGVLTTSRLGDTSTSPYVGPDGAARVKVATGTDQLTRVIDENSWPTPAPRIKPDAPLTIYYNPPDAAPPVTGGGAGGCSCPPLDFTPLQNLDPGSVFPFGIYAWVRDGLVGQDANAPAFDVTFKWIGVDYQAHVDLAWMNPAVTILRALLAVLAIVGVIWGLAHRLQGWGTGE